MRIGLEELSPTACPILGAGYTLALSLDGPLCIHRPVPIGMNIWGFNAAALAPRAEAIACPDEDLIYSLTWGFDDCSCAMPNV